MMPFSKCQQGEKNSIKSLVFIVKICNRCTSI